MCGFCGFTGKQDDDVIKKMTRRIAHRGPDDESFYIDDAISLGFRRLSFFDLEYGGQPMTYGKYTIVFNGEIYNFRELREIFEARGRVFKTDSDTEVLLHLYESYGERMLEKLRGMFAFAIYNSENGEIFAARDFFGIKPFYYGMFGGELLFASEIKAFLDYPGFVKELNHDALVHYLSFQYNPLDETFFKGVFKLPAAHFLRYKNGAVEISRWWQADFCSVSSCDNVTLDETAEKIDAVFKNSVEYHQFADVPIGALLSGGTDSSYVTAVSGVRQTFTVGFENAGFSEIEHAKNFSQEIGAENFSKIISPRSIGKFCQKFNTIWTSPLPTPPQSRCISRASWPGSM